MRLQDLYARYHETIEFVVVYIREAHAKDGWWLGGGLFGAALKLYESRAATDVVDPVTLEQRRAVAGRCESALEYGIRTLVDDMDDTVNRAYAALPTRLYLVDTDGVVRYAGGLGPYGFKPAELEQAIRRQLNPPAASI